MDWIAKIIGGTVVGTLVVLSIILSIVGMAFVAMLIWIKFYLATVPV
jgi:hypothetical protein